MHTTYETRELRLVCTNEKEMKRKYQDARLKGLRLRVAEMRSADRLQDLLDGLGRWHPLVGRGSNVYAARLSANWRIVAEVTTAIHVLAIEDYHR